MDRELLIEIGTEEIPASWLPGLTAQIGTAVEARLKDARLSVDEPVETYSTPRRLAARVGKIGERQTDLEELVTGPPVSAAFAADGTLTPAGAGFAKKQGVPESSLERIKTAEGRIHRRPQASARQDGRRRAAGGAGRRAAQPVVPEADAMGRDARPTARASCRLAARSAGSCSCTAAASCRSRSARSAAGPRPARAGPDRGRGDLRASLPDHERTRRPRDQGEAFRRLPQAAGGELRRARAQRAPRSHRARARRRGAPPRRAHRARAGRPRHARRGAGPGRVPGRGLGRLRRRVPAAAGRSADDDDDSSSAFLSDRERPRQAAAGVSRGAEHGARASGGDRPQHGARAHGPAARRAVFPRRRSQEAARRVCRSAEHRPVPQEAGLLPGKGRPGREARALDLRRHLWPAGARRPRR